MPLVQDTPTARRAAKLYKEIKQRLNKCSIFDQMKITSINEFADLPPSVQHVFMEALIVSEDGK